MTIQERIASAEAALRDVIDVLQNVLGFSITTQITRT